MAADQGKGQGDITLAPVHDKPTIRMARDKATDFLANHAEGGTSFTTEEEKVVLRRIDLRVLPLLLGAYFFQQLDKSSLSYVSIFGITDDAPLVGKHSSGSTAAAFILVKLPTGKVIATAISLLGCSLAIMSACTDFKSLLGMRFVLGSFEAMIAPSCVAVTQMWWRRSEQTLRTSYWNAMNGVTICHRASAVLDRPGLIADLIMFVLVGVLSALIPFYLMFLNRRHARRREELGKTAEVVDESMVGKSQLETSKAVEVERSLEEDNALQDMPDVRNEDFIFVY
ncbi:hypothetical protein N0V85_008348 [Neurospora sp. IMI 360204]|nr:hypothetical protein N0V85_008348 [Neurospora sp. IMI 360204]